MENGGVDRNCGGGNRIAPNVQDPPTSDRDPSRTFPNPPGLVRSVAGFHDVHYDESVGSVVK